MRSVFESIYVFDVCVFCFTFGVAFSVLPKLLFLRFPNHYFSIALVFLHFFLPGLLFFCYFILYNIFAFSSRSLLLQHIKLRIIIEHICAFCL